MAEQTVRKTCQSKVKPTPDQARMRDRPLLLARHVDPAAIAPRRQAWHKCGVSVGSAHQQAALPPLQAELPE
jgi:hypothetical protein